MIYIPILLIIIILAIDFYFTSDKRLNKTETLTNTNDFIEFLEPNPWTKIQYTPKIKKYYVEINDINKYVDQIIMWKQLPFIKNDMIDIDVENNYLILKALTEEESLVICNLIICYINEDITIEEIVDKNLVKISINKAKKYKLVCSKLIELIKAGLLKLNNPIEDEENEIPVPMSINEAFNSQVELPSPEPIKQLPNEFENEIIKEDVPFDRYMPLSRVTPYEGNEYASIKF